MSQRILLIQDDVATKVTLAALRQSIEQPFQVDCVHNCAEALDRLQGIVAIIVDFELPDSRGIDTFDRLFRAAGKVPILILIDQHDEGTARQALQRGAQDYLLKGHLDTRMLYKAVENMIARAATVEALLEEKNCAQATLNSIGDAVISTDARGLVTFLNVVAEGLIGWSLEQALGHPLEDVFRIVDATTREPQNPMALAIRQNKPVFLTQNCVLIRRDGLEAAIEDSVAPIRDRRGLVTGAVMVFHDVSVARALTLKMSYLAQHDSLTDLPNRVLLNDRLSEAIALSSRYQRKLAVLFLDLDRFKHINDSLGHVVGDRVLQAVARRLFTCVRSSDTISRQGGDEFIVLLWEVRRARDAAITAAKILQALREPYNVNGHELHITGSIGIVTYPNDGADAETLLKKADVAMYHAKEQGRDNYKFFTPEMNASAVERQSLETDLRCAIEKNELILHYQSKIDLLSGSVIGAEALLRWRHPQRGLIPPAQFIVLAEECGLIVPIGRWVLREACRQSRAWQLAGLAPIAVAINVSSVELRNPDFVAGVDATLKEAGLNPRYLELDLAESVLREDSRSVENVLDDLKRIGVLLAVDDYGTGYSSLRRLTRFPIDCLKIDRSFVRNLTTDENNAGIVNAVIGIGKSLNMLVVAEGVETREQLDILQERRCPQAQGYLFSRPVPSENFRKLLQCPRGNAALP
jgi:diguanylate cyclase (GGDEF)-like protein/PAS domain S-box-containing protein